MKRSCRKRASEQFREEMEPTRTKEEGKKEKKKMKVMVAVDESEYSLHALAWVLDHLFLPSPDGELPANLVLVHAEQPFHYIFPAVPGPAIYATSSVMESVRTAQEQNAANVLSRAIGVCKKKVSVEMKAETLAMNGEPKEMICQAAEQMQVDLLVVGSRGLSKLKRAFLGSVSDYVAHHAKCPVLIAKPSKEEHQEQH